MKHEFNINLFRTEKADEILNRFNLSKRAKGFVRDTLLKREGVSKWFVDGRIVYLAISSNGLTGRDLLRVLNESNIEFDQKVLSMLMSSDYITSNNTTIIVAIINGRLFQDRYRTSSRAKAYAKEKRFYAIGAEAAVSIRLKFTNDCVRAMGFEKIVVMHEPIEDESGTLRLINISTTNNRQYLTARSDNNSNPWSFDTGFAFEVFRVIN